MAKKVELVKEVVKKQPTKHKIVVTQGRVMSNPQIEYKVLYTEVVPDRDTSKVRVKELLEQYKEVDSVSVCAFSM